MSEIQRICVQCGASTPLSARYCGACGYDFEGELPAPQNANLPAVIGKAALPVLLAAGSVALRLGWRIMQSRWAQAAAEKAVTAALTPARPPAKAAPLQKAAPAEQPPAARSRRTITIRSSWAVGDANGVWRQGVSEQRIDLDE